MSVTCDFTLLRTRRDEAIAEALPRLRAEANGYRGTTIDDTLSRVRLLLAAAALAGVTRATRGEVNELLDEAAETIARARSHEDANLIGNSRDISLLAYPSRAEEWGALDRAAAEIQRLRRPAGRNAYLEAHDLVATVYGELDHAAQAMIATNLDVGDEDAARAALVTRYRLLCAPAHARAATTADLAPALVRARADSILEQRGRDWVLHADRCTADDLVAARADRLSGDEWEAYQVRSGEAEITGARVNQHLRGALRRIWRQQQHAGQYPDVTMQTIRPDEVMDLLAQAPGAQAQLVVNASRYRRNRFDVVLAGAVRVHTPDGVRTWVAWAPLGDTTAKTSAGRRRFATQQLQAHGHAASCEGMEVINTSGHRGTLPFTWPRTGEPIAAEAYAGTDVCLHAQATWYRSTMRDTLMLACPECGHDRVAVVPLHRVPEDQARVHLARMISESYYLRRERYHRVLAGQEDFGPDVTLADLREREGTVPMNPGAYGIGLRPRPTLGNHRGLRGALAGRR